ncbi:MAG: glycosyltransferase family 39 protein [Bacteroidia bacterium]|nr:glycosyltransferase family 39 protein [Bacteroidia bacterium]
MVRFLRDLFFNHTERFFLYIGILHFIARMVFQFLIKPPIHGAEDLDIALHLAEGKGFSIYDRGPTTAKGPFYPLFLAFFLWLGGDPANLWPPVIVQHFLLSWMPLLLYQLSNLMLSAQLGRVVGLLFAFHPSFFYYPTVLENTPLFIFLTVLWGIGLYKLRMQFQWGWAVFLGLWLGLAWLEKPVALIPMLIAIARTLRWKEALRLIPFALLVIGAWALRGYLTFGYPTWTKTYAGQHAFIISWHPKLAITPKYAVSAEVTRLIDSLFVLPEKQGGPALEELGRKVLREKGLLLVAERTLLNAVIFWWIPPRYWANESIQFWIVRKLPVILVNLLFFLGALYGFKRYKSFTLYVLTVSALFTGFYAANHVLNIRYRLDVEWLQLYLCGVALLELRNKLKGMPYFRD